CLRAHRRQPDRQRGGGSAHDDDVVSAALHAGRPFRGRARDMSQASLRHLLVTGGAGFLGSAFVRQRLATDPDLRVTVLDKLTYAGSLENLAEVTGNSRFAFLQGHICDRAAVARAAKDVDAIVTFAAASHVDRSLLEADDFV